MKNLDNKVSNVRDRKNLELGTVLHDNLRWQRNCCFMLDLRRPTFLFHWDITMSKFFFHVTSKGDFVRDFKGRELTDLSTAHRHAMLLIHKMVSLDDMDWRGWSINVTDASNRSVLSVLFPQMSFSQNSNRKNANSDMQCQAYATSQTSTSARKIESNSPASERDLQSMIALARNLSSTARSCSTILTPNSAAS
jgi:hypothetical protein